MFSQNEEDKKLDWMYKNPSTLVDREEYLLGRTVDKTLDQLNEEEKQKQSNSSLPQPKNHVEHECIPPSIRDYKLQVGEQVDLSAKLQEDPLVAIKKREEETRRQFLQNPVQLKKLQEALLARQMKTKAKKKKKKKSKDSDLDTKLAEKLKILKSNPLGLGLSRKTEKKKKSKKDDSLDIILMHKFNELKDKLSDDDLRKILRGEVSDSDETRDSSSGEEKPVKHKKEKGKKRKKYNSSEDSSDDSSSDDEKGHRRKDKSSKKKHKTNEREKHETSTNRDRRKRKDNEHSSDEDESSYRNTSKKDYKSDNKRKHFNDEIKKSSKDKYENKSRNVKERNRKTSSSSDSDKEKYESKSRNVKERSRKTSSSSDSDKERFPKKNWGLVKADGSKISFSGKRSDTGYAAKKSQPAEIPVNKPHEKRSAHKLSEEEKERRRKEMMENAAWRDVERAKNVKRYKESDEKDVSNDYNPEFVHKELLKSANTSTVESRIKANINKIQRSGSDMNTHFSRRH